MGLAAEQFANTNANFANVTFEVTDGYITVSPIDVTVTITGHNSTVDYDGEAHTVSGYDAVASTTLYDVTKDFTFSGTSEASQTNAGTAYMGMAAEQFANTNANFANVTFEVTDGYVTVTPVNITVTITGHTGTVDYDGKSHTVSGYDAVSSSALYDVTKDFTFSGSASASTTNASTIYMKLTSGQFKNINSNFANVTFNVTDGYIKVEPIDVTVKIVGNNKTADYDETIQTVTGYTASTDNELYDVKTDLTFKGTAEAKRGIAGTTDMGLDASRFENKNQNFARVTFSVTDGYITILPVDAELTAAPEALELTYDDTEQELVAPGLAKGGTIHYALGENGNTEPGVWEFAQAIPTATECGIYYVWYKVVGDDNHNDLGTECVKVCIVNDEWSSLSGTLYQSDGKTPVAGAVVTLTKGNQTIDTVVTGADGKYTFTVPDGVYNIVAEFDNKTLTILTTVSGETEQNIDIPDGNTESILKVNSEDDSAFDVSVGGLDKEARDIRKADNIPDDIPVSVTMTVEAKAEKTAANADTFFAFASNKIFEFFEIKVEKTVDAVTTVLDETTNILEIAISYPKVNKRDLAVYSVHGGEIREFTESDSKADGTFRIDKENNMIFIYSSKFSTYAIGYTPYFKVNSTATLGSFKGKVTVTLVNKDDGTEYTLENVSMEDISFDDIPMGNYEMKVVWEDGAQNTLTMPLTITKDSATEKRDAPESSLMRDMFSAVSDAFEAMLRSVKDAVRAVSPVWEYVEPGSTAPSDSMLFADRTESFGAVRATEAPAAYDFTKQRRKDRFQI
ncbi:MAG: carboxypeptidase regulatory-like domain-containing protein, partial [Clostridia bacterium]|nr:carboxypeptidase regulatory-like domain-containing protein [Clostridia bacterium]